MLTKSKERSSQAQRHSTALQQAKMPVLPVRLPFPSCLSLPSLPFPSCPSPLCLLPPASVSLSHLPLAASTPPTRSALCMMSIKPISFQRHCCSSFLPSVMLFMLQLYAMLSWRMLCYTLQCQYTACYLYMQMLNADVGSSHHSPDHSDTHNHLQRHQASHPTHPTQPLIADAPSSQQPGSDQQDDPAHLMPSQPAAVDSAYGSSVASHVPSEIRAITAYLRDKGRLRTPGLFVNSADAAMLWAMHHPQEMGSSDSSREAKNGCALAVKQVREALDRGQQVCLHLLLCYRLHQSGQRLLVSHRVKSNHHASLSGHHVQLPHGWSCRIHSMKCLCITLITSSKAGGKAHLCLYTPCLGGDMEHVHSLCHLVFCALHVCSESVFVQKCMIGFCVSVDYMCKECH